MTGAGGGPEAEKWTPAGCAVAAAALVGVLAFIGLPTIVAIAIGQQDNLLIIPVIAAWSVFLAWLIKWMNRRKGTP